MGCYPLLQLETDLQFQYQYKECLRTVQEKVSLSTVDSTQSGLLSALYAFTAKRYLKDESGIKAGIETLEAFTIQPGLKNVDPILHELFLSVYWFGRTSGIFPAEK
jgi:hypothetical protein